MSFRYWRRSGADAEGKPQRSKALKEGRRRRLSRAKHSSQLHIEWPTDLCGRPDDVSACPNGSSRRPSHLRSGPDDLRGRPIDKSGVPIDASMRPDDLRGRPTDVRSGPGDLRRGKDDATGCADYQVTNPPSGGIRNIHSLLTTSHSCVAQFHLVRWHFH